MDVFDVQGTRTVAREEERDMEMERFPLCLLAYIVGKRESVIYLYYP